MILQALCKYYDILDTDPNIDIPSQGYSNAKISYALNISKEGELKNIISLKVKGEKGNKLFPRLMTLPFQEKRASGIFPYFLSDNSKYVFGLVKDKNKPIEISEKHFESFKKYNLEILENVENDESKAVKKFLNNWDIQKAEEFLASINGYDEDIFDNSNFVFILDGKNEFIHDNADIKKVWISNIEKNIEGERGQCLITGEDTTLALLHGNLKGVRDAQPAGAAIVSFNIPSFISYGKQQSYNAPVGVDSAFKYVTVLNYMLQNDSIQKIQIGDTTTVFWAESAKSQYSEFFNALFNPTMKSDEKKTDEEKVRDEKAEYIVKNVLSVINQGGKISDVNKDIDDDTDFYILGLSPNNARISIRYFYKDTFGNVVDKINQHYKDLELEGSRFDYTPLWIILNETIVKQSKDKKPSPLLAGRVMRSILTGQLYPDDLYLAMIRRIRCEQDDREKNIYSINHTRVSVIKAYLTRKLKEVLPVSLNEDSTNVSYNLGRLFALLEKAQEKAQQDINSTIKDKFFATASASPAAVFPALLKLSQHHLRKIKGQSNIPYKVIWPDNEIEKVMDKLELKDGIPVFPTTLNSEEQGIFIVGYYHQRQHLFKKKEVEKELVEE